jgi:hypothetical protein
MTRPVRKNGRWRYKREEKTLLSRMRLGETMRTMRSKETPKTKQYPHPQEERAMTPRNARREANARYANINLPSIT